MSFLGESLIKSPRRKKQAEGDLIPVAKVNASENSSILTAGKIRHESAKLVR